MNSNKIEITKVTQSRLSDVDFSNLTFGTTFSDHMFITDYDGNEWTNSRIVPFGRMDMHPATMSLHYGQAIFEGMKASKSNQGEPLLIRPELHAKRINASARRMCMAEIPEDLFLEALHKLIGLDHQWIPPQEGSALYIRPFMFATDEFVGVRPSRNYRFIIFTCPVGPYYSKAVKLKVEMDYIRAANGGTGEAKAAGNYAAALLPSLKAQKEGYDQVIWMDAKEFRYVQEVGTMNIFFVMNGKVYTPATDGSILKGITRMSIMEILRDRGYEVIERPIDIDEVLAASKAGQLQEVFGAGTAAVVATVAEIGYKEERIVLPPVTENSISQIAKNEINGLRSGRIEDTRNWIVKVKTLDAVNI